MLRGDLLNILHAEKRVTTGPALKPRSWIINEMMEDESLQKVFYEVAQGKATAVEDVKTLAKKYATEIAAYINYSYIEMGLKLMRWVIKNIYDGITINSDGLTALKRAVAQAPVILVPNHKSHMDYLLLSTILYENNITIPHVAAGLNLSFWPMGHIFRRCGAFFLRRKFSGNQLYREVFKTYLKMLLREGHCQEFFIEGGRSRTGKLLMPKLGLLTMLMESIKEGAAKEAFFVPVSITYDQVIEKYEKELKGEEKKKERTRDLLRLSKHLKRNYGRIFVRFGEPLKYEGTVEDIAVSAATVASKITYSINKETVVTPVSLVSSAILAPGKKGMEHELILHNAEELYKFLKWKGAPFSDGLSADFTKPVLESIELLEKSKVLQRHDEFDPMCYEITEDAREGLDYYKNGVIHYFVSISCVASIMLAKLASGRTPPSLAEIKESYAICKRLFEYEFSFSTRFSLEEHVKRALSYFENTTFGLMTLEIFKGLIKNFFESYLTAFLAIREIAPTDEKALVRRMLKFGRHMLLLGKITRAESISAASYANALKSYVSLGLLKIDTDSKGKKLYFWDPTQIDPEKLKLLLEELV